MLGCSVGNCEFRIAEKLQSQGGGIYVRPGGLLCGAHAAARLGDAVNPPVLLWHAQQRRSVFPDARSAAEAVARALWDPATQRSMLYPDAKTAEQALARTRS